MINILFAVVILGTLFILLCISVAAGRSYGRKQMTKHGEKLEVIIVAEGAVFTLLALLVAFAFSGAYDRFEHRKLHIIEESGAVSTAYQRIDLLAPQTQPALRESFRHYIDAQLAFYKTAARLRFYYKTTEAVDSLENKLWTQTIAALKITNDATASQLFIPAVNNMFELEKAGIAITRVHPPTAIFILLIGLAILSGFLAGYSTAESKTKNPLHILCYVVITAFTIYIIIDLEFPRIGLIRVDSFDQFLINVRNDMK